MTNQDNKQERRKKIVTRFLFGCYSIVAVFTFGHAWNRIDLKSRQQENIGRCIVGAPFCAALWPLYWSVVLQEDK